MTSLTSHVDLRRRREVAEARLRRAAHRAAVIEASPRSQTRLVHGSRACDRGLTSITGPACGPAPPQLPSTRAARPVTLRASASPR